MSELMVSVRIGDGEEYPVYWAIEDKGQWRNNYMPTMAAVPKSTFDRWNKVVDEYEQVQQEMSDAMEKAIEERRPAKEQSR